MSLRRSGKIWFGRRSSTGWSGNGKIRFMQEIEVKARLRDRDTVMQRLASLGCAFKDPIEQEDAVYVEKTGSLEIFLSNKVFLRIRVNDGSEVILTAKKRTGPLVAIEYETTVASKEEVRQILLLMGYQEAVRVHKVRVTTEYQGCEICVDEVEGLGSFIEMEKLTEDGDAEKIQEELFGFFASLGIVEADRVTKGYDLLMFET